MRTLAKRTTGRRLAVPAKRSTTPRAPFTRPRRVFALRVSITCAPSRSSSERGACARKTSFVSGMCNALRNQAELPAESTPLCMQCTA